jgi:YebC/PmpR family DNA-binding regulatory protein
MAGHSHFANIKHKKGAADAKKSKIFTKIQREIISAIKTANGEPSEEFNPRLRLAIIKAKGMNMPKEKIDAAIKKATGANDGENFEAMRYDCYGPAGVGIVVEALTDNKNRTVGEIRSLATKCGGNMGETGSLDFIFTRLGVILYNKNGINFDSLFEKAAEFGADDVEEIEDYFEITTQFENFHKLQTDVSKIFGDPIDANIQYRPISHSDVPEGKIESIQKFIDSLEDLDDVQNVWAGI